MKKTIFTIVAAGITLLTSLAFFASAVTYADTEKAPFYEDEYRRVVEEIKRSPSEVNIDMKGDPFEYLREAYLTEPEAGYGYIYYVQTLSESNGIKTVNINAHEREAEFASKLNESKEVLNGIKLKGSNYWKIRVAFDELRKLIKYHHNPEIIDYSTIYGAVIGRGNCQAYSKCFKYIMDRYHIPCEIVYDTKHMWNVVKLEGKWYNIDATLKEGYGAFLVADEVIGHQSKYHCTEDYPFKYPPENLYAERRKKKVVLVEWDKVDGSKKYIVSYKKKGGKWHSKTTKKLKFKLKLKTKKKIWVKVRSLDTDYTDPYLV